MNKSKFAIIVVAMAFFIGGISASNAQEEAPADTLLFYHQPPSDTSFFYTPPGKPDTVCYKYGFLPKDTVIYRVGGMDSIIYDYEPALNKKRYFRIMIVCDSVKDGRMYLTQAMTAFTSTESKSYITDIKRDETPWLNRKSHIVIDSVGTRLAWSQDDSTNAAMSPGGAFEPVLLFPFKESCKGIDESWIQSSKEYLPENGVPVPVIQQSALYRAMRDVDTLGEKCTRMRFIRTGQGAVYIIDKRVQMAVTSVINSSGMITFSKKNNIPIHFFATIEQKMKIKTPDQPDRPAWQFTNVDYVLEELRRHNGAEETAVKPAAKPPVKKKKSKK